VSKGSAIQPGSVVWAVVPDRNGQNSKERPLLVIPPAPNGPGAMLCCLAISTEPGDDPADPAIEMPWNAEDGDTTGLYQWCRAVLLWHMLIDPSQVTDHSGRVTRKVLDDVLAAREVALAFPVKPRRK